MEFHFHMLRGGLLRAEYCLGCPEMRCIFIYVSLTNFLRPLSMFVIIAVCVNLYY